MIFDEQSDAIIVNERYGFIQQLLALATVKEEEYRLSLSDKIDRVLTHRLLALPIFALFHVGKSTLIHPIDRYDGHRLGQ